MDLRFAEMQSAYPVLMPFRCSSRFNRNCGYAFEGLPDWAILPGLTNLLRSKASKSLR
jgi:hypothetical protein